MHQACLAFGYFGVPLLLVVCNDEALLSIGNACLPFFGNHFKLTVLTCSLLASLHKING